MVDFKEWDLKLQKLYDVYTKFDDCVKFDAEYSNGQLTHKAEYIKDDTTLSEQELCDIETELEYPIPPSLRETFLYYSKKIFLDAHLPHNMELPNSLKGVFCAYFLISSDELINAERSRKEWIEGCFNNPNDPYDSIWYNKLGFMTVPNGDVIAFDLSDAKEDKRVVYLSHDDGEGHGFVLGESFDDYFSKLLLIGACGNEGWQMLPFVADSISGIIPNCDNAKYYREIIGLSW